MFEHERSHYEQVAEEHLGVEIESAQSGIGGIPDRVLRSSLLVANIGSGSTNARSLRERCLQLLEVMRRPQGGNFLRYGTLSGIQLALAADKYLTETPRWSDIRHVVDWFGKQNRRLQSNRGIGASPIWSRKPLGLTEEPAESVRWRVAHSGVIMVNAFVLLRCTSGLSGPVWFGCRINRVGVSEHVAK